MRNVWIALAVLAISGAVFAASMEMTSARLYKKQGELQKSLQFYDSELQKNPGNGEAYYERGELLGEIAMDVSKSGVAREISGNADSPQRILLERMLADFAKAREHADAKTAAKLAKKMDEITNDAWAAFYAAAVHQDSLGAHDKAIEQADMAITVLPSDWRAFGLKAQMMDKLGRMDEALAVWEAAHEHLTRSDWAKEKPEDYRQAMDIVHGRLLEGYYNSGNFARTIGFADEVLKLQPNSSDAIQFKAFALAQMAADESRTQAQRDSLRAVAVESLNEARKSRPDYSPIVFTIGQFNLQLGDTAQALSAFEDYLKLEPADRDARFIVGVLYLEGGSFTNTSKARDTFKALTEQHPEDAAGWINYGVSLIRLGDNAGGKQAIEKGKSLGGGG